MSWLTFWEALVLLRLTCMRIPGRSHSKAAHESSADSEWGLRFSVLGDAEAARLETTRQWAPSSRSRRLTNAVSRAS